MDTVIKILQFIVSLSLLVIIHEFGHFLFARLFKTRVEKFYLFSIHGFRSSSSRRATPNTESDGFPSADMSRSPA